MSNQFAFVVNAGESVNEALARTKAEAYERFRGPRAPEPNWVMTGFTADEIHDYEYMRERYPWQ